jgi:hypothetical protein
MKSSRGPLLVWRQALMLLLRRAIPDLLLLLLHRKQTVTSGRGTKTRWVRVRLEQIVQHTVGALLRLIKPMLTAALQLLPLAGPSVMSGGGKPATHTAKQIQCWSVALELITCESGWSDCPQQETDTAEQHSNTAHHVSPHTCFLPQAHCAAEAKQQTCLTCVVKEASLRSAPVQAPERS